MKFVKDPDGRYKTELLASVTYRGVITPKDGVFYGAVVTSCDPTEEYKLGTAFKTLSTAKRHVVALMHKLQGFHY